MKNTYTNLVRTVLTCIALCTVAQADDRPNIIFMMADDMGKEWMGCYGGEGNHTPNIDKLAATGLTFDNAYSMPKCVASRMTLMTGQYPARNGYVDHWEIERGRAFLDPEKNPSWAFVMRQGGYKTCALGKWQLTLPGRDVGSINELGFDDYFLWVRTDPGKKQPRYWTSFYSFGESAKPLAGKQFNDGFGPDHTLNYAKDFIARNKQGPFFLYYAFHLPHVPFVHTPHSPNTGARNTGRGLSPIEHP
jgi:arylsulfatase A-like enzyme